MIRSPSIKTINLGGEDPNNLSQLSISALLNLFPRPPTSVPSKAVKRGERKITNDPKKSGKLGSILRSSWAGNGSTGDIRKPSATSTSTPVSPISATPPSPLVTGSQTKLDVHEDDRLQYKLPAGLPDKDYVDLLKRACKGVIAPKEQDLLFKFLLALPPTTMKDFQKGVHDLLTDNKPVSKSKSAISSLTETLGRGTGLLLMDISKYSLDFNMKGRRAQINETVKDSFAIDVKAGKIKYTIKLPEQTSGYELSVEPTSGKLKTKEKDEIKISVTVKRPVTVNAILVVEIEGSIRHFVAVNLSSEWSHFGCMLDDLEYVDDEVMGRKHRVPKILVTLRQLLLSKNGFDTEEVFRKQLDDEKTLLARQQFDKQQHLDSMSIETISTLIKVWFRELPERIFDVTISDVIACDNEQKSLALYADKVKGKSLELANWLFDVMAFVIQNKEKNRMTSKKLAIVFAPNVFPVNSGSTNAEYFRKQADVFFHILENRLTRK